MDREGFDAIRDWLVPRDGDARPQDDASRAFIAKVMS